MLFGFFIGIFLVFNNSLSFKDIYNGAIVKKDAFLSERNLKKNQQEQENEHINNDKQTSVEQQQITLNEENVQQNNGNSGLVNNILSSVVHIKGVCLTDTSDRFRWSVINSFAGEVVPDRKTKSVVSGSGFFVSNDGYILTNNHVIKNMQEIDVETYNGNKYNAKLVAYDESSDLALLKVLPKRDRMGIAEKFNAVKFGNSDNVNVGDPVIVIGGPYGNKWSVSSGIVSSKSREDYREYNVGEFIQIDAAVNPGNSGGPSFNANGEVIGVNTFGYSGAEGLNFAISQKTVSEILPELLKGKIIARGLWGISVDELQPWDVKALKFDTNKGMIVQDIIETAPAYKAGIRRGDVIMEVNGMKAENKASMVKINKTIMAGSLSTIKVNRYGEIKVFKNVSAVSLKEAEKLAKGEIGTQEFKDKGMNLRLITSLMHNRFRLPKQVGGIVITSVFDTDPSFMLQVGDVIMQINNFKINTIEDYEKVVSILRKNKKNDMAMFHVYRPTINQIMVIGSKF